MSLLGDGKCKSFRVLGNTHTDDDQYGPGIEGFGISPRNQQ